MCTCMYIHVHVCMNFSKIKHSHAVGCKCHFPRFISYKGSYSFIAICLTNPLTVIELAGTGVKPLKYFPI